MKLSPTANTMRGTILCREPRPRPAGLDQSVHNTEVWVSVIYDLRIE